MRETGTPNRERFSAPGKAGLRPADRTGVLCIKVSGQTFLPAFERTAAMVAGLAPWPS